MVAAPRLPATGHHGEAARLSARLTRAVARIQRPREINPAPALPALARRKGRGAFLKLPPILTGDGVQIPLDLSRSLHVPVALRAVRARREILGELGLARHRRGPHCGRPAGAPAPRPYADAARCSGHRVPRSPTTTGR